jgi:putative transposase
MPWRSPMDAKRALIFDVNDGVSVSEAADRHGVTRSCAHKWVGRYRESGWKGLEELSRRPERSPNRISQELVDELLELKRERPDDGPVKLSEMLRTRHGQRVMAASTAGEILARHGQVTKRRPRHRGVGRVEHQPYQIAGAGDSMTTDFKGQFLMGNGTLCYPLTIADPFSRYVLGIRAMGSTHTAPTKAGFERVFREYGIPRQMISDNGTPFCSANSLGGLTQLSRWWIELGITPVRIEPGRPDQNGIHERMHRTLKNWIVRRPQSTLHGQQRSFDQFRRDFNHVRPHQSLGQKPPVTAFRAYRPFGSRPKPIEYDLNMDVRLVNSNGEIKWNGQPTFVSEVLIGARIGLLAVADSVWSIHFGPVRIGYLDAKSRRTVNRKPLGDQA